MMWAFFGCSQSLVAMHESIKTQIKILKAAHQEKILQHRKNCFIQICHDEFLMGKELEDQCIKLVLNAGDLVSDQEKLNYANENKYYPQRKEIIKKMVIEGANPNNIIYRWKTTTPMGDAISHKDEDFIGFLHQHGAIFK